MIEHFVWQTSWGISWRLIGAIIMTHGDDKGLIIPPRIAPIQVVIVPIYKDVNKELVVTAARRLKDILGLDGIRAHLDDRDEYTSGWKFNYWETKGVPLRVNLGPRDVENNQLELVRRDTKQKDIVANADAIAEVKSLLAKIQINLFDQAVKRLDEKTNVTSDLNEAKILLETKTGFISTFWCGNSTCEEKIKDETSADIRLIPFEGQDKLDGKLCISCGLSAKSHVILGRAY